MGNWASRLEPLSSEPCDWGRVSNRDLYRTGCWILFTLGLASLWLLAAYRALSDYVWAIAVFSLLLVHLRAWHSSTRRERVLMRAYVEMSDLHAGFVKAVREVYERDADLQWLLEDDEPEEFWGDLVDKRTAEMFRLGVAPLTDGEIALTLQAGSRYAY